MKKLAVIATMVLLSVATMTACGNRENKTGDNQTSSVKDNTNNPDASDQNPDDNNTPNENDTNNDPNEENPDNNDTDDTNGNEDTPDNTNPVEGDENSNKLDSNKKDEDNNDSHNNNNNEQKEPVETGEQPDFKLNKKGCFNGSYEGNDGCTYKFTKKGKLIITSDSETIKYEYTINNDVLSMIAEDGSFGTSRQITLLEDGTYLLDDKMGNQVILSYIEA